MKKRSLVLGVLSFGLVLLGLTTSSYLKKIRISEIDSQRRNQSSADTLHWNALADTLFRDTTILMPE